MQFRPTIFIWFVFAQFFFKFYKNGVIQKLNAQSFQRRENYFCMLNIERPTYDYLFLYTLYFCIN